MSKRGPASSSTPRKKTKLAPGQPSLDRFFSASPRKDAARRPEERPQFGSMLNEPKGGKAPEDEQVEPYVLPSTERDGRQRTGTDDIEIIDVDMFEESSSAAQTAAKTTATPPVRGSPAPKFTVTFSGMSSQHLTLDTGSASSRYPALDVDSLTFDLVACPWPSARAPFSFLSHIFVTLTQTRSRIRILNIITNGLRVLLQYDSASLLPTLWLLSNALSPPYSAVELGLGPAVLSRAIQQISGLSPVALKTLYNKHGDPGRHI
jgi:DNA ligase 1